MILNKLFPRLLLVPDANAEGGASSTPPEENDQQQMQTDENGAQPDAFDTAAAAAIDAVQATAQSNEGDSPTPKTDEQAKTDDGKPDSAKGELNEDGSPKQVVDDKDEKKTDEEKVKEKDDKKIADAKQTDDTKLPFHNHPRFKEVIAERDTFKTEAATAKVQYEQVKPLVEAQQSITAFLQQNNITPQAFQETLQFRALMNTDPAKALEQLMPIVADLQAIAGKGILDPVLLQKVKDGVLDEDSAKEITRLRAQSAHKERGVQHAQQQAAQDHLRQMEQSVTSWFTSKKTADSSFEKKLPLINGVFSSLTQKTPPRTPNEATALLEAAYVEVNKTIEGFQPTKKPIKAPLRSNASRAIPAEPDNIDDYAAQVVDNLMGG